MSQVDAGGLALTGESGFLPEMIKAVKTVATEVGDVALDVPRDRSGMFGSRLVPEGSRHTRVG